MRREDLQAMDENKKEAILKSINKVKCKETRDKMLKDFGLKSKNEEVLKCQ